MIALGWDDLAFHAYVLDLLIRDLIFFRIGHFF